MRIGDCGLKDVMDVFAHKTLTVASTIFIDEGSRASSTDGAFLQESPRASARYAVFLFPAS